MHSRYLVLQDIGRERLPERGSAPEFRGGYQPGPGVEPSISQVGEDDLLEFKNEPNTVAVAPIMPTKLVGPHKEGGQQKGGELDHFSDTGVASSAQTGHGVVVAILDTGIESTHEAFVDVKLRERDFCGFGIGDQNGHGTHSAGILVGREAGGNRIGVAPNVREALVGTVLGPSGDGESKWLFDGILWAVNNRADVISLSLGFDFPGLTNQMVGDGWPLELATSHALESYRTNIKLFDSLMAMIRARTELEGGVVVVAAAGNESRRDKDARFRIAAGIPAAAEGILSVGAVARHGKEFRVAPFSNKNVDLVAPGVGILSAKRGGGVGMSSGTSAACPQVAGIAALWWEALRNSRIPANASSVASHLVSTARIGSLEEGTTSSDCGFGLVTAP